MGVSDGGHDHDMGAVPKERQEQGCENILADVPAGLYIVYVREGNISHSWIAPNIADITGYAVDELESNPDLFFDIIHPLDRDRICDAYHCLGGGIPLFEEYRIFRKDGQMRRVRDICVPPKNAGEDVARAVGFVVDITAQPAPIQFKQVLDDLPYAVHIYDASKRIIYCNNSGARLCGCCEPDEMIGRSLDTIIPAEYRDRIEGCRWDAQHGPWLGELIIRRADGCTVEVSVAADVISGSDGNPTAYYVILTDISEVKQAELELMRLSATVDAAMEGIGLCDVSWRPIYINSSLQRMIGYTFEECIEYGIEIQFADQRQFFEGLVPALRAGHLWQDEVEIKRKDGRRLTVDLRAAPAYDERCNLIGYMASHSDVTKRKRAEESLRESEELLRAIQDSLSANIAVLNREGVIIAVNEPWKRFACENGDPILAHTCTGINYLDVCRASADSCADASKGLGGLQAVLAGFCDEFEMEYPCHCLPILRWYLMRATRLAGSNGGLVIAHQDITERVKFEEALRVSEEKYRTLAENVDAVIFRVDPNLHLIAAAGNLGKISDYSRSDLTENPNLWLSIIHPEDIDKLRAERGRMMSLREPVSTEARIIRKDGAIRWVRLHGTPSFDGAGELKHIDCVSIDITDQVEAREREARRRDQLAVLADISQALSRSFDVDQILSGAAERIGRATGSLCLAIGIDAQTDRFCSLAVYHRDESKTAEARRTLEEVGVRIGGTFGHDSIGLVVTSSAQQLPPELGDFMQKMNEGPIIAEPVFAGADLLCVLAIGRTNGSPEYDEEDVWLLTEAGSRTSAALVNALLYRRQARIAETLQRSLIPKKPAVKGLEVATSYMPALGEAEVGGDFYDVIDLPGDLVGVVVGDVSGKGIEAAIHTAQTRYMLRGFALQNPDPGPVVTHLNQGLLAFTDEFTFVTLTYILIDPGRHQIVYVNAGHESPLIVSGETCSIRELRQTGPVLGVISSQEYPSGTAPFEPDDLLFCYTDGVTDIPSNGERFGYDRLIQIIKRAPCDHPQELLDHVVAATREFGHGKQPDDQVIVVIRPRD